MNEFMRNELRVAERVQATADQLQQYIELFDSKMHNARGSFVASSCTTYVSIFVHSCFIILTCVKMLFCSVQLARDVAAKQREN